jgi:hypothetical protein
VFIGNGFADRKTRSWWDHRAGSSKTGHKRWSVCALFLQFWSPVRWLGASLILSPPPARVDDHQPASTVLKLTGPGTRASASPDRSPTAEEKAAEAYRQAAEGILRRLPNVQASVGPNEPPITGRIPVCTENLGSDVAVVKSAKDGV